MTKVVVDPGVCGFIATIEVAALSAHTARVTLTSDCESAIKVGELLKEVDWFSLLRQEGDSYSAYLAAVQDIGHITCPVPVAILKAVEAELGLALPKDVVIRFKTTN
jgi:hypothetical protein